VSDTWYYANQREQKGPITLLALKETLAALPNAEEVLVWREGFQDWKRAGDVVELKPQRVVPPPLPPAKTTGDGWKRAPPWKVRWWWCIVALVFLGTVGSRVGRDEMGRLAAERRKMRISRRS
jgi:hypothetical protein